MGLVLQSSCPVGGSRSIDDARGKVLDGFQFGGADRRRTGVLAFIAELDIQHCAKGAKTIRKAGPRGDLG
jgi:hypothetical protein